jgi:hypothetical protein
MKMARTKSVKEHEDINLHISKVRFWSIILILVLGVCASGLGDLLINGTDEEGRFANVGNFTNRIAPIQLGILFMAESVAIIVLVFCFLSNEWIFKGGK